MPRVRRAKQGRAARCPALCRSSLLRASDSRAYFRLVEQTLSAPILSVVIPTVRLDRLTLDLAEAFELHRSVYARRLVELEATQP